MSLTSNRLIRRAINSLNYRIIDPLTGRKEKEWAAKTDFVKTHRKQVDVLKEFYPLDQAVKIAIGGEFETIGPLLRELLIYHGLQKDHYVIDVGCGAGRLAKPLSQYPELKYLGIDVVPDLLNYARNLAQRPDWRFEPASGLTIPEQDQQANMVCFFSVFTHLLHEESFVYLREAKRVLKPGGKVIVSFLDFNIDTHWTIFQNDVKDIGSAKPLNIFMSPDILRTWAKHLDLEVEIIKDANTPYVPVSEPITFEDGTVATDKAPLWQSLCVMVRK